MTNELKAKTNGASKFSPSFKSKLLILNPCIYWEKNENM